MTNIKTLFGSLVAVAAAVVGVVAFGAAQASASSGPIVISYEKECNAAGRCEGTAESGGERHVRDAGQPTRPSAHRRGGQADGDRVDHGRRHLDHRRDRREDRPAGFIVLNGTVTDGSFEGARSTSAATSRASTEPRRCGTGELQLKPASA